MKKLGVYGLFNYISVFNLELNWVKFELGENFNVYILINLENLVMYFCFDDFLEDRIWGFYVRRVFFVDLISRVN